MALTDGPIGLYRVALPDGSVRLARGPSAVGPTELLAPGATIDGILGGAADALGVVLAGPGEGAVPTGACLLPPVESQEIWAAGVTYLRSRDARVEESNDDGDCYIRVYDATRPEIFFKAPAWRSRGPGAPIGVRADSTWDVPEPELGLVINADGAVVGLVIGNDVSSRSIEGENPLYLPQAKVYTGSCALGPCIVPIDDVAMPLTIEVVIRRGDEILYQDRTSTDNLRRTIDELAAWLTAALDFPVGCVLLTGTCLVPSDDVTLDVGDETEVSITGLGVLRNTVERVGRLVPA